MAVNSIQIAVTSEGLESIATMVGEQTVFTIRKFRLTDKGDETFYESHKQYTGLDPDSFYMPMTAEDFNTLHSDLTVAQALYSAGLTADAVNGYVTVNNIKMADSITVEIDCYIPPTAGTSFTCNEIMLYTGSGTLVDPYKSFMWGIFPEITKTEQYGVNFRVLLQF
jgi:hypothetical protein